MTILVFAIVGAILGAALGRFLWSLRPSEPAETEEEQMRRLIDERLAKLGRPRNG